MKRGSLKLSQVSLPDEIISKILTFLPVKPLLRFRCVSKGWNSLIGGSDFVKEHLDCSGKTQMNKKLILRRGIFFYSGEVDQDDIDAEVLDYPCVYFDSDDYLPTEIMGSCRGLVLLCSEDGICMLWNPFTRTHHVLPDAGHACKENVYISQTFHGLGYDEVHEDYKVVRVVQILAVSYQMPGVVEDYNTNVMVFSLKLNSWKRVSDFPHFIHGKTSVFVNGALHYIVGKKRVALGEYHVESPCLIASFDVRDETYRLVPQPDYKNQHFTLGIGELGGYLCMIRHYDIRRLNQVWVMKEYGVGESWTELFRICQNDDPMHSLSPLTYVASVNQVLVKEGQRIGCVDMKTRSSKPVEISGTKPHDDDELDLDEFDDVCVCTESLVFLDSVDTDANWYDRTEQTHEQNQENSA